MFCSAPVRSWFVSGELSASGWPRRGLYQREGVCTLPPASRYARRYSWRPSELSSPRDSADL